jgi:hypothetical protein
VTALEGRQIKQSTVDQDEYAQAAPTISYTVPFLYELAVIIIWLMGPIVLATLWIIFDRQGKPIALVPCSAFIAATVVAVRCIRPVPSRITNLILALSSALSITLTLASVPYLQDKSYLGYIWRARHAVLRWAAGSLLPFLVKALVIVLPITALLLVTKALAEWLLPLRTYRRFIAGQLRSLTTKAGIKLQSVFSPTQGTTEKDPINEVSVRQALDESSRLLIMGNPGSGKTTTMTRLALELAEGTFRGASLAPIFLRFSVLSSSNRPEKPLVALATQTLASAKLAKAEIIFNKLAKRGRIAFLLDGFDELAPDISSQVLDEVESLMKDYPDCVYVISTRTIGLHERLRTLFESRFEIQPMSAVAIAEMVRRYFRNDPTAASTFLELYDKVPSLQFRNPLILTIMLEVLTCPLFLIH